MPVKDRSSRCRIALICLKRWNDLRLADATHKIAKLFIPPLEKYTFRSFTIN